MKILVSIILFNLCVSLHAQDSTIVARVDFEYNDNGALIAEIPVTESNHKEALAKSVLRKVSEHLVITRKSGKEILSARLSGCSVDTDVAVTISSLSGIQMFREETKLGAICYNLTDLPKGTYVITLSIGGETESKKYIHR